MNTYALSVGPIVEVIGQGKTTREVWGASFYFSFLVKTITKGLLSRADVQVLSPLMATLEIPKGAGVYPDLIIWKSPLDHIAENDQVAKLIKNFTFGPQKVFELLRVPLVQLKGAPSLNYFTESSTAVSQLENAAVIPETATFWFDGEANERKDVKSNTSSWINAMLVAEFKKDKSRLRSLIEVSAVELETNYTNADAFALDIPHSNKDSLWSHVAKASEKENLGEVLAKAYPKKWRMRHKYLAVVHGDGDRIGAGLIGPFGHDEKKVKAISQTLADYSAKAATLIATYGGQPIYTGGDDLFFFAPLSAHGAAQSGGILTLADLLQRLSELFQSDIEKLAADWEWEEIDAKNGERIKHVGFPNASTSFGVHIMHYKQPLDRAIRSAQSLLFAKAKQKANPKPAVAMRLEMHSSAPSSIALWQMDKDRGSAWAKFSSLLKATLKAEDAPIEGVIFSSLQHKIAEYLEEMVTVSAAGYNIWPFYERLTRQHENEDGFKKISEDLYNLVKISAQDCLKHSEDTSVKSKDESLAKKVDGKQVDQLRANLQLALKLAHLMQRKDIDNE